MQTVIRLRGGGGAVVMAALRDPAGRFVGALRAGLARWRQAHRSARARAELEALSDHTLADLGLRRSEIGSLWSELEGLNAPTRRRARRP